MSPEDFLRSYEAAPASHDLEATLALIADDAVYLFSNQASHFGKGAIREALRRNFDAIVAETYAISDVTWLVSLPEVAVALYQYRWSGKIQGKDASGGGRGTTVLRREGDSWRVVHEHLSAGRLDRSGPP